MQYPISPLDGRYGKRLAHLSAYFSEFALMRWRVHIELRFLSALDRTGLFKPLTDPERARLEEAEGRFKDSDYRAIKEIESEINHDVKACEVYLRNRLQLQNPNMIHFGLTSEDVNNLAYNGLLQAYIKEQQIPQLMELLRILLDKAKRWRRIPFPARTHGQMASPTTAGKEMTVFINRLLRQLQSLETIRFRAKLNGASGNYSALMAAFPDYDWSAFARQLIEEMGFEMNEATTQIEDHDTWAAYFSVTRQINHILLDMNRDVWFYLTLGNMMIAADEGAVGSSTMPHKVNPINFENSEGNLQLSNALLTALTDKFGQSRLQRDLSDSTVERNIGVALSHAYLAVQETAKGLRRLEVNEERCHYELNQFPELLAEPIQTILRREGFSDPYGLLKHFTRGKHITPESLTRFIDDLQIDDAVKKELKSLDVSGYTGAASQICDRVIEQAEQWLSQN